MMYKSVFAKYIFTALMISSFYSCEKDVSTTPMDSPPASGKIILNSNPQGAQIFINGDNTGKVTPDSIIHIESGLYRTKFRLSPYLDIDDSVYIAEENTGVVFKNFYNDLRNYGKLVCQSNPAGALVAVNDSSTGLLTPVTLHNLWPGYYKITYSLDEHREAIGYVSIHGGETKSVSLFPQDTSICVDYNYYNSDIPAIHTSSVVVDREGVKWIGNNPGGIVKIEGGQWTLFNTSNSPLHDNSITCIEVDIYNNKWIGTSTGLDKIDADGNWTSYTQNRLDYILAIACDDLGNTWISTSNFTTRRKLVRVRNGEWEEWPYPPLRVIISLTVDNENKLWAGLDRGVMVLENDEWKYPPGNYDTADNMVKFYAAESIKYDPRGFIWIGYASEQGGPGEMYIFDGTDYTLFSLPEKYISHIHIAENLNVWVSCHGRFPLSHPTDDTPVLMKIDPNFNITGYSKNMIKISSKMLKWSCSDTNGDLWIASRDKGIIKFKGANL